MKKPPGQDGAAARSRQKPEGRGVERADPPGRSRQTNSSVLNQ